MRQAARHSAGFIAGAVIAVMVVSLMPAAAYPTGPGGGGPRFMPPLGITNVLLTEEHVYGNAATLKGFVETGSTSDRCLLTVNEWSQAAPGLVLQCSPRMIDEKRAGLIITAYLPAPPEPGLYLYVNVFQENATTGLSDAIVCADAPVGCD